MGWLGSLALTVAVIGCESGNQFPPSDVPFAEFCPRWQADVSELYRNCDGLADAMLIDSCAVQSASYAAGRIGFDQSVGAGCLHELQTASCSAFRLGDFPACDGIEWGLVPDGGVCANDDECAGSGDHFCDQGAAPGCPGVCRARFSTGGDCSSNMTGCPQGDSCVTTASNGKRCTARVAAGGACGPGVGDCADELACATPAANPTAPATCQALLFPGDACAAAPAACASWATCGADGACALLPTVGDPCGQVGAAYVNCRDGYCDGMAGGDPGVCQALLPAGAACHTDAQCGTDAPTCASQVCAAPVCPAS